MKFTQSCSKTSHTNGCINVHICTFATVTVYIYIVTVTFHFSFLFFSHIRSVVSLIFVFISLSLSLSSFFLVPPIQVDHPQVKKMQSRRYVVNSESSLIKPIGGLGCSNFCFLSIQLWKDFGSVGLCNGLVYVMEWIWLWRRIQRQTQVWKGRREWQWKWKEESSDCIRMNLYFEKIRRVLIHQTLCGIPIQVM